MELSKFNVYVKRKSAVSVGPEYTVNEFLLISLVSILSSQEDIEYFTISKVE